MTIELKSPAFRQGETIPEKYTGTGRDMSPPLEWKGVPENARTVAIILDDPDAPRGVFNHWVIYNVAADQQQLDEHVTPEPVVPEGIRQGTNDFGKIGYKGPAPPPGEPHHYFFHIYALDCELHVPPGSSKDDLLGAMHNHILDEGQLMGTFAA